VSSSLIRPNTIEIERQVLGAPSATGEPSRTIPVIATGVPALIDLSPDGELSWLVEGTVYTQDAALFIDGLRAQRFAPTPPGSMYTFNGIGYLVAQNGLGAYPDVQINDRITDEGGQQYLVLAIMTYYNVLPTLEARLARGRTW
jgi:hypothetical protein